MGNYKRCLFLTNHDLDESNGISKKIVSQVKAIEQLGYTTYLVSIRFIGDSQFSVINGNIFCLLGNRWTKALFRNAIYYNRLYNFVENKNIQILYIRYTQLADIFFLNFLRRCKKLHCRVYMEIPTYPYDGEFPNNVFRLAFVKFNDRVYRNFFHFYVDRIVTFSTDNQIFGIDCINISNAVDENLIPLVEKNKSNNKNINFIGVANLNFWHGYDRMVEGINNYYNEDHDTNVCFYIVGEGNSEVEKKLAIMINKYKLNDYIFMVGPLYGRKLDNLFNSCDIAVGSLGSHRKRIVETKTLKNVEYAMRGLPIIYSEKNNDFDGMSYVYKVPADDSAIDVSSIVSFFNDKTFNALDIRNTVSHLTWINQMKRVFSVIRNH